MCNITELGMCSLGCFLSCVCQPFMSEMQAWSCSEVLGQQSQLVSKSQEGTDCLEGNQAGMVLSSAPHPGASSGAVLGNWRV